MTLVYTSNSIYNVRIDTTHFNTEFEDDLTTGRYIVGRGGFPNARGILECDAAVMDGCSNRFGAVAALKGYIRAMNLLIYVTNKCFTR